MGFFSNPFGSGSVKEREEAARLGITITELERDVPYFRRTLELKRESCVRYSIPRNGPSPRVTWSLLQRNKAMGATLPNDYLVTSSAPLPSGLEHLIRATAEEYSEEFFEFEGTESDVAVFWDEWGGPTKVQSLHALLSRLAQC